MPLPHLRDVTVGRLAGFLGGRTAASAAGIARRVALALPRDNALSWDEIPIGRAARALCSSRFRFDPLLEPAGVLAGSDGASWKFTFRLGSSDPIEVVLIRHWDDHTLCLSTQVGCALGCTFCATGSMGLRRNLTAGEITEALVRVQRERGVRVTDVVFMGMGEPLLNLDAVLGAAAALTDPARFGLGARHITISTSGVVPGIERLARLRPQWTLAISLHAARDPLRDLLVPLNRRWPVGEVVAAARAYGQETGRRVSYEYVMIDGINDTAADADAVVRLLRGSGAHVNCIPMNPVAHTPWRASAPGRISAFADRLRAGGLGVTVRRNRGQEVGAACGQLAAELAGEPSAPAVARRRELLVAASAVALRGERSPEPAPAGLGLPGRTPRQPAGPATRLPAVTPRRRRTAPGAH